MQLLPSMVERGLVRQNADRGVSLTQRGRAQLLRAAAAYSERYDDDHTDFEPCTVFEHHIIRD
jgi:hypothetical protein